MTVYRLIEGKLDNLADVVEDGVLWAAAAAWRTIAEQNGTGPGGPRRGIRNLRGLYWDWCCANASGFGHARVISALSGIWESGEYIRTGISHWGGIAHNRRSAQVDQVPASRSWDRAQQAPSSYILNTGGRAVLEFWPRSGLIGGGSPHSFSQLKHQKKAATPGGGMRRCLQGTKCVTVMT